jgi:uncharacterized glyoxalase superfamily protein PhnB
MYLELVFNGHEEEASKFYKKFFQGHKELYGEDLKSLGMMTKKKQMLTR